MMVKLTGSDSGGIDNAAAVWLQGHCLSFVWSFKGKLTLTHCCCWR